MSGEPVKVEAGNPGEISPPGMDIVLVSNSPGELSSWVRVMAAVLKRKMPSNRIVVALVPCPFASGSEVKVAHNYKDVDIVIPPGDFMKYILTGIKPWGYEPASSGIVVFMGGDLWHASALASKLKYPATAYSARPLGSRSKNFELFFCPDERIKNLMTEKGISPEKIKVVGNLVIEGVRPNLSKNGALFKYGLSPGKFTLGILPGSRLASMEDSLPVFLKVVEEISSEFPEMQFLLGVSPFRSIDEVERIIKNPVSPIPGAGGVIDRQNEISSLIINGGIKIPMVENDQHNMMKACDVILTIPGTNTAECAYLGVPMIVSASWKARIPGGGLGFVVNSIPVGFIRKAVMSAAFKKLKFFALPNIMSGRQIVPEVRVEKSASEITGPLADLVNDSGKRERISIEMKKVMGEPGASEKIADSIINILNEQEKKN